MPYAWLLILLPAAMAAFLGVSGSKLDDDPEDNEALVGILATGAVVASFVLAVVCLVALLAAGGAEGARQVVVQGPTWMAIGDLSVGFNLLLDPLSVTMALVVTGVGSLIHWFARGYMHGDPHFARFFALLNLFVSAMLILVLASNLGFMFLGWEGVGFCSYMLIGYYTERDSAVRAGKKAFLVNRIGDLFFLLGLFLCWNHFGTLEFTEINAQAGTLSRGLAGWIGLLLFIGATGKSAQFPLYVWLPDAMEGPTPVSALIHAATMVTAGVYLVCRMGLVYVQAQGVMTLVAFIGLLTAVLAALVALVQTDIKRVLAYSTVSQLGYMFLAAGMGAFTAAIFHLITHAFFKALLFLGSGSVIHGLEHALHGAGRHDDPQDLRNMGGLAKTMPTTCATMVVGALAISGFPLLAGFWSKDEILHATGSHSPLFMVIGLGVALLTAFYMFRMIILAFFQEPKLPPEVSGQVHESSPTLTWPLLILGGLSIVGGALNLPGDSWLSQGLHHWLDPSVGAASAIAAHGVHHSSPVPGMIISTIVALAGIALAYWMYQLQRGRGAALAARYPQVYRTLAAKYWLDEFYLKWVVEPGNRLAQWSAHCIDERLIDGSVNGLARGVKRLSGQLTRYQPGQVRSYALWFVAGAVGVVGYLAASALGGGAAGLAVLLIVAFTAGVFYVVRPAQGA